MKALIKKINRILKDRRTRRLLTRIVSVSAAVVVFVTTYALVLPAITMEAEAQCGIEAHQHDDSCYEDVLVCGQEESEGHTHDESCYSISQELICEIPEHQHDENCYDEDGNLQCQLQEHEHTADCYKEVRELTCTLEESEGHHHTDACYEKNLICGKEVHTHSPDCYEKEAADAVEAFAGYTAGTAYEVDDGSDSGDNSGEDGLHAAGYNDGSEGEAGADASAETDNTDTSAWEPPLLEESAAAATTNVLLPEDLQTEDLSDGYVPQLDSLYFDAVLNDHTAFYYFHPEEGEEVPANTVDITSWEPVDKNTELAPTDLVKAYLSYTIPAGSLNETNQIARYRLPANIHLTDDQIIAINNNENGIAAGYVDPSTNTVLDEDADNYHKYLGAEAVEGTRRPDQDSRNAGEDGFGDTAQEYISATVKAENVFDEEGLYGEKGAYLGQDLIFVFSPYTIEKNQTTYDTAGNPTAKGEKVTGWFAVDLNMEQIDWSDPVETILPLDDESQTAAAQNHSEDQNQNLEQAQEQEQAQDQGQETVLEQDQTTADDNIHPQESVAQTTHTALQRIERTANVVFVAEGKDENNHKIHEISTELKLVQENEIEIEDEGQPAEASEEQAESPGSDDVEDTSDPAEPEEDGANTDTEAVSEENKEEQAEKVAPEYKDGTLEANGSGYKITMDYKADAQIPENAYLHVKEITRESDEEAYEACLEEARKSVPSDGTRVDDKASRFFDIEILVDEPVSKTGDDKALRENDQQNAVAEDEKVESDDNQITTRKIEPAAPVSVNIQLFDTEISQKPDEFNAEQYKVVHIAEDKTEEIQDVKAQTIETEKKDAEPDTTERESNSGAAPVAPATEVQFEAESFSIYGVVYTVDFHWEVDGKTYDFSLPGGGYVSLRKLVQVMGIAEETDKESDEAEDADIDKDTNQGDNDDVASSDSTYDGGRALTLDDVVISDAAREFVSEVEKVEFTSPDLIWVRKVEEDIRLGNLKDDNDLTCAYSLDLTGEDIVAVNDQIVESGDWAIVSLQPFTSEETLTVTMKNGDIFTIKVTDAQSDAIIVGGKVQTIPNPNGTTIDLFDYWIDPNLENDTTYGRNDWPKNNNWYWYSPYDDAYYGDNGLGRYQLYGQGNNSGINHGHAFKFTPAQAGSVMDGTLLARSIDASDKNNPDGGVNSWTHGATPRTGIVEPKLDDNGYPVLTTDTALGTNGEPLDYLFDNSNISGKARYGGVNDLLYVDPDGYYTYNSHDFNADFDKQTSSFTVTAQTAEVGNARGFWPFGNQHFWLGMHMHTDFSMPVNGKVLSPKGEYNDMEFTFQGDDDTWLYVDGVLVGDGGGIHNQTLINVNFREGTVLVSGEYDAKDDYKTTYHDVKYLDDLYIAAQKYDEYEWVEAKDENGNTIYHPGTNRPVMTFKNGTEHKFDMFYIERGGGESNLRIHYNLISTTDFSAHKSYHMPKNDPHARLNRNQFKFELIGYDNTTLGDGFVQAIMPVNGTPTGDGSFESPKRMHNDEEGYTSLLIGVTEDGNVNFGNVQLQESQVGMTYRYMVREVVDPEAENADGIKWKNATEEQKAEGGFVNEDGITYDGRVYYFTGTVEEVLDGNNQPTGKYVLKKTRYTDSTYQTVDEETKFFSFVNGHVEPLKLKVLKKSDSDSHKPLSGAQFSLVRAKHIVEHNDQGNVTSEHWIPRPESTPKSGTTSSGTLTFNNLTEGHYILEETAAPAGYTKNGTSRWLLTLTKEDSADEIVMIPTIRPLDENGNATGPAETLDVDNTHTIEHEVLNTKLPRGPLTVQKKWIKPDGTTEYTAEELNSLEDATGVTVTGQLCRRYVPETAPAPTVRLYARKSTDSAPGELMWSNTVQSGSDFDFMAGASGTGNPMNYPNEGGSITTSTGATVTSIGSENVTYSNGVQKDGAKIYEVKTITQDTDIYVVVPSGRVNDQGIGYKIKKRVEPETGGGQPVEQQVGTFTLDSNNHWTKTWTSEQLNEDDYDYEYYLKNVSEPSLEGYVFIKDPEVSTEVSTGSVTFAVKNIKEGPMTDLTVRKVWGDGIDHSGETISYKIQRKEFDAAGNEVGGPYDYIEFGKTASEIYTLSNSDVYNGVAWQKHHNKLPATNGKEETDPEFKSYQYSVVEVNPPADYTASYYTLTVSDSGNEYSVSVIKNTPTDARVSVEKKWLDFDGVSNTSAGIPEGAYITGTLKRSYTWQEASGTTVRVYNRLWQNGQILSTTLYKTYSDVQDNSDFSLWAIDSNGNEPLNGVSANGSAVSQTGTARSYNMGDRNEDTNAFVIHVNGQTDVIMDWAYNSGFQNGWHYDVDYTTAAAGSGQTHNETETVGTFRIDASNDWKWAWTDRELDQDHVYTYFFYNVQEHSSDGTVVAHFNGFNEPEIGSLTQGSDGKWTATIKNVEKPGTCSIKVTKQWEAEGHDQDEIQFTLMQRPYTLVNGVKSYQAEASEYTGDYTNTIIGNSTVTINDLPARAMINNSPVYYEYFVNEDIALEGFHVSYILVEGDKEDQDPTNDIDEWKIINSPKSDAEEDTFIEVDKSWVGDPEGTTHENDNITYKVKQEAYSTDYIPVRFVKKDSSGAVNDSQTYYVEKNGSFTVHINTKKAGNNRNIISRRYSNSGQQPVLETEETIQYNSQNGLVKTYEDLEGPTIIELQMTVGNSWETTAGKNKWVAYVPGDENPGMYSSLESLVADEATGTPASIAANEFLMTATATERKGEAQTFGTINPDVNGWKSKIEDLPLYNYDNGAGYVYKYSVAEIYINTDEVIDNETDFYTVTSSTSGKVTTLVNTAKETMKVQAEKKWFEPGGEPTDEAQEPNASIQFKLIRKTTYTPTGNAPAKDAAEAQYTVGAGADGYFTIRKDPTTKKWTLEVTGLPLTGKEKVIDGENTYIYNAAYSYKIEEMSITKANGSTTDYDLSNYHISYSVTGITSQDGTLLTGNGVITINNERILSVELPESGGPGTTALYLLGIMLTGFAGMGLVMRKRKRDAA